jgi:hypothetical protein
MAEADLKLRNSIGPALFMFNNTSLPGNSFSPISLLDFTQPDLPEAMPVWDPTSDLKQLEGFDNMDISAVPFSVDPLKALDLVKRRLGRHVRLGGDRIDMERDVRENLVSTSTLLLKIPRSDRSIIVCCLPNLLPSLHLGMEFQAERR